MTQYPTSNRGTLRAIVCRPALPVSTTSGMSSSSGWMADATQLKTAVV